MRNRNYLILAGAVLAASPLVGKAVTMTFTYDATDTQVNGVAATLTGPSTAPTLSVPLGATIDIGVDVSVSGNPNSTLAYHGVYDSVAGSHHYLQPQNLGIASFGLGFTTSSQTVAPFDAADNGGVGVSGNFATTTAGSFDGSNNILIGSVSGGNLSSTLNVINASQDAELAYGGGVAAELFNGLQIDASATGGTAVITPTGISGSNFSYIAYNSGGTSSSSKPVYKNVGMTGTDTFVNLPALTIIVGSGPITSTSGASHSIINLTAGTTPAANYGSADGTIAMTGVGNGSYNVAHAVGFTNSSTGSVAATGWNPSTDKEIYALKLSLPGGVTDAEVVADINGTSNGNTASPGVTASLVTGVYTTLFPGYDVLLTSTASSPASGGAAELSFDFSSAGEGNTADAGITVTGVAAVPEPATAAGIVLGAAGLLLGRRRNKALVA
jgi:hypothetical protein